MSISGTVGRKLVGPARALALGLALAAGVADAGAQVACGDLVAPGTTVTLGADLGPCDGVAAAIVVESATLDLGGRTVTCADADGDGELPDGIVLLGKKARVRNGTVVGCFDNVVLAGAGRHAVEGVTAAGARWDGIYVLTDAAKNRITGSTVVGNGDDGVKLYSARNTLRGNLAQDNAEDGFDVIEANGNKLLGNTTAGNGDDGIDVNGVGNKVAGNTVRDNGGYGIAIVGKRNKIVGNTASGSGTGQDIAGADCSANVWRKNVWSGPSACQH
jgi:parallel beta-helix repeat protein